MGRIDELKETADGTVREAVVILPSHRKIRRPINLLVPLELEDGHPQEHDVIESSLRNCDSNSGLTHGSELLPNKAATVEGRDMERPEGTSSSRYNLRPRQRITYNEHHVRKVTNLSLMFCLVLAIFASSSRSLALPVQPANSNKQQIRCILIGVELISPQRLPYRCAPRTFVRRWTNHA
ncbi:hypothetical protein ANCCEY_13536 [Ancylostoma ceylanicum]|uniref:Uncharacterized protein n=1 Tax=Ancylostoma ceylanicum TaxID=53326 RepID=A0A0D6L8M1_9BILA|nr:hypothetical protein ANCCEY_13536 [Ancylostoma ceylanicum]